jgi:hypothetical protein
VAWRAGAQRVDTSALRQIVREELGLGEDDTLTVSEMACTKDGCPPVETVISIFPAGEESYLIRVCKAIADVEPMDVLTALAFGDHREGFDPTRFL